MKQSYKIIIPDYIIDPMDYGIEGSVINHISFGNTMLNGIMNGIATNGKFCGQQIRWIGSLAYMHGCIETDLYNDVKRVAMTFSESDMKFMPWRFLINETKKQFVDLDDVESILTLDTDDEPVTKYINPLPLLMCEGYGFGTNETYGDTTLFGFWAKDVITVSNMIPDADYNQLEFNLKFA